MRPPGTRRPSDEDLNEATIRRGRQAREDHLTEEERRPCRWLMLADTGNDRYVNLGVVRVPERVEATGPGCDVASVGQEDHDGEYKQANDGHQAEE